MVTGHSAFGGRVVFYTRPTSLKVSLEWGKLERLIEGITHDIKEAPNAVTTLIYLITSTDSITFHFQGDETALLTEFREMWQALRPYSVESVTAALDWALCGALEIREDWQDAVTNANKLWIDPVDAPIEQLDPALQEAAVSEDHPLPSDAPNAAKKIGRG